LGFGDVKSLTQILSEAVYSGATLGDIFSCSLCNGFKNDFRSFAGSLNHLLKYEQQRLRHNVPIMFGIHGLQRLYNNDFTPLVALRSAGLRITNSIPPLKVQITFIFYLPKANEIIISFQL
jgi:ubiquinone biosynthesis monooxygenase Coq6